MANKLTLTKGLLVLSACIGFVIMFAAIVHALLHGDLSMEGPQLVTMPWGIVSLVDIYLGLLLFSIWIMWREQSTISAMLWVLLVLSLGNLLTCLYILKAVLESRGSAEKFWLGENNGESNSDV